MRSMRAALGALVLVAGIAQAQTPSPSTPPPTLAPVVVEAPRAGDDRRASEEQAREEIERVPGGVEIVGEQAIREGRAANLQDVLQFVPGVLIRPRFGAADESQLSVRGSGLRNNFHLRGINVLLDGFPYGAADGFSDFESLELLDTKRLEVYKGANALRYGASSLGGAVNLVTRTGHDEGRLGLRAEAGSYGFFKNHLATGQVQGPLDLYLGITDTRLQGYRQHSEQARDRVNLSAGYALGGGAGLRLDAGYVRNQENLPGALTREEFEADPRQRNPASAFADEQRNYDYTRGGLTFFTPLGDGHAVEAKIQLNYQDLHHPLAFAVIAQDTSTWSAEGRYLGRLPLGDVPNRLVAGLQYFGTRQNDDQYQNRGNAQRGRQTRNNLNDVARVGAYVEAQIDATGALLLVLGLRLQYTWNSVTDRFIDQTQTADFFAASPRVGFVWTPRPGVQVFGNASHGSEPPLLLELTAPGNIPGDLDDLEAQRAWQFELGTRGRIGRLGWDLSIYDIELWDELQNVNVRPFPGAPFTIPRYQNIPRSRHTGVEAGGDVRVAEDLARRAGLGRAADALVARLSYTWSRFKFVNDPTYRHNDLPGAPAHFVVGELRYDHGSGFWAAPGVEWVPQGYAVDSANRHRTSPYALANLSVGFDHAPWQLSVFFLARNLADKHYISAVAVDDANGRYFYPGDGRAFYGGLQWRFR